MSQEYCILNLLNIEDKNINLTQNFYKIEKFGDIYYKVIEAKLTYKPEFCPRCGCIFNNEQTYEKNGFITSDILMLDVCNHGCILRLHKQRFLCHCCNKKFIAKTKIVNDGCFISNQVKYAIALELKKKISEVDIAHRFRVSPNTVERVIDSYYEGKKLYKNYLPEILSFDEFKSVKSADGAMSFHMCNGITGMTIDIVEDRRLISLLKYFGNYSHKARASVKFIVIDMYSPYVSLINQMFPNAKIIIDSFHLIQLISRSLNKTRIKAMKTNKNCYNKLKRYWKLLLKSRDELDFSSWKKFTCFNEMMTESDVVNFIINQNVELKATYLKYQDLLSAIKSKNKDSFLKAISSYDENISDYMKTSMKTFNEFKDKILNTFDHSYHNGFIEGNNNFIKVLKRIAFGFRSFLRFKARIMICKGLVEPNKKANAIALA